MLGSKKEEDVSSLHSKFAPGEISFALVVTLAKLGLDINDLSAQKSKLIEVFLQLIFDKMCKIRATEGVRAYP